MIAPPSGLAYPPDLGQEAIGVGKMVKAMDGEHRLQGVILEGHVHRIDHAVEPRIGDDVGYLHVAHHMLQELEPAPISMRRPEADEKWRFSASARSS